MLLIYDGDCGFCTTSAAWVRKRLDTTYDVQPWQALNLAKYGLTEQQVTTAAYWVDQEGRLYRGHLAVGEALKHVGSFYRPLGYLATHLPFSPLAALTYSLVAKYRYKLPGSTDACKLPER